MTLFFEIAVAVAVALAIALPIVGKLEKWKKEMDEDE